MDKRDFLKGLGAAIATMAVLPKSLKAETMNNTLISPVKTKYFRRGYDSVSLTYIKEVLGRAPDDEDKFRQKKIAEGWEPKSVNQYYRLVPPNHQLAARYLQIHAEGRRYYFGTEKEFADIA